MTYSEYELGDGETTFGLLYENPEDSCSLHVGLICDDSIDGYLTTALELAETGTCHYKTTLTSQSACSSFDLNALWDFLEEYSYVWGVIFIVAGGFLGLFGRKLIKAAIFLVTAICVVIGTLLVFYTTFLDDRGEAWIGWSVLACSIIVGLIAGFFMMKLERVGAAILSGWGGFLLGVMLSETL